MAAALDTRHLSTTWFEQARFRRRIVATALVLLVSIALSRLVLAINFAAVAALLVPVAAIAVALRPRLGLYLLFAIVLFFDGVSLDPIMLPGRYLYTSLQTTFNISGGILIPFEMVLLLATGVWLAQGAMRRRLDFQGGAFGRLVLLFACALLFGIVRGIAGGANINYMFWESRFLFSLVLTYFLAANTIRTRQHVRALLTIVFIAGGLSALEGILRKYTFINAGLLGPAQETWYTHEGVVLWGLVVMLVLAQQVFGAPRWMRILGPLLALATVFAMLLTERRAGLVGIMIALGVLVVSLFTIKRKAFFAIGIPAFVILAIYLPLFWNNTGTLGQGARAVRSISTPDPRDAASNAWRDLEAINVRATIASDPLMGIGFGRPFLQVVTVPDISGFEFWNYEAHHDILWIWMKIGAIGFMLFFALMLGVIARAIWLAKSLVHPELRTFALLAMTGVVMALVFCYVDLGLTGNRIPMMLGLVSGVVGVLDRIGD